MAGSTLPFVCVRFKNLLKGGLFALVAWYSWIASAQDPLPQDVRDALERDRDAIAGEVAAVRELGHPRLADAAIFSKGLTWALEYDKAFSTRDIELLNDAVQRCRARLKELSSKRADQSQPLGTMALGYTSSVDGSAQPYGLIVPKGYSAQQPMRLDVVLHGSMRPVGMTELQFIAKFDHPDSAVADAPDQPYIELHPLGRVENCYRWAGETDVFEAIEDVCRRYAVDRRRIVLRGMSMGASGTWHLGLKHPDRFVALGPYCGYVDTHRFSETPFRNFVKVGPLPIHQEQTLHMLDAIDYAANAGVVPAIACMGEKDIFFDAHVMMGDAMRREGLEMVNLISPGTGHSIDPVTHAEQMRRIGEHVVAGMETSPSQLRFVTWTLKYSRCHWVQLMGLDRHYTRSEFSAAVRDDVVDVTKVDNIPSFAIDLRRVPGRPNRLRVDGQELAIPALTHEVTRVILDRGDGHWSLQGEGQSAPRNGKRPGIQGPIDDAYCTPFLCVRGTGTPWNPQVQGYADARLRQFAREWHHYFRGELPVKDDRDVGPDDVRSRHLVLFGDPGSNSWLAQALPQLPLSWTPDVLKFNGHEYAAADHLPALILPNPLDDTRQHYVVTNTGHTFHEAELGKINYLLFPRWGDWAVLRIPTESSADQPLEEVERAGFFNENWKLD